MLYYKSAKGGKYWDFGSKICKFFFYKKQTKSGKLVIKICKIPVISIKIKKCIVPNYANNKWCKMFSNLFSVTHKSNKDIYKIAGIRIKIKRKYPYIPEKYGHRKIIKEEKGNEVIKNLLQSDQPFLITRLGRSELNIIDCYLQQKDKDNIVFPEEKVSIMQNNAGFFPPTQDNLIRFSREALVILTHADMICPWMWDFDAERYVIENYAKNAKIVTSHCISKTLFFYKNPWVSCLKGKKVLVIHPFEATIKQQYKKLPLLFRDHDFAPNYSLITIKAVQGIGQNYKNLPYKDWFDALEYMKSKIDKCDFDIAIIGAGAYGMFLADYVKSIGKQAIHMCGATQLLFGIKGVDGMKYPNFAIVFIMNIGQKL